MSVFCTCAWICEGADFPLFGGRRQSGNNKQKRTDFTVQKKLYPLQLFFTRHVCPAPFFLSNVAQTSGRQWTGLFLMIHNILKLTEERRRATENTEGHTLEQESDVLNKQNITLLRRPLSAFLEGEPADGAHNDKCQEHHNADHNEHVLRVEPPKGSFDARR